jgi:DNA polymerase/3'-5' exonuclease PolX
MGYKLNEYGLYKNNRRVGLSLNEKSILKFLGVESKYLNPRNRQD